MDISPSCNVHLKRRRILVVADKFSSGAIAHLKNNFEAYVERLVYFGDRNADYNSVSISRMSDRKARAGHIMKNDYFSGAASELVMSDWLNKSMMTGIDHLQRRSEGFDYRNHMIDGFYDSQHYYQIIVDVIGNILQRERIDVVIFFDIPHLFYDTLLYQVAKSRNIETLIIRQSVFTNRILSLRSIEDYGILPPIESPNSVEPLSIDKNDIPEWHYMRDIKQERSELGGRLTLTGFAHLLEYLVTQKPTKLLQPWYIIKLIGRMRNISSNFPKWRDPFAKFFHVSQFAYFETLMEFENNEIDFNQNFVYFPLQLQPEMTTSALGGRYNDQALAIERLSLMCPEDCLVYVKENPKQTAKMRSPMFFHRLRRIRNVRILPSFANTHELIDHAEFVATITGTVGWEAICRGKIVVVFGSTWYRSMPGVIKYHENLTYEEVCNSSFEHEELERYAGWLKANLHTGVIDRDDAGEISDFDQDENDLTVAKTLIDLLSGKSQSTFQSI